MNGETIRRHKGKRLVVLGLKLLKVGSERKVPPSTGLAFRSAGSPELGEPASVWRDENHFSVTGFSLLVGL
jgi:hypothetical protein